MPQKETYSEKLKDPRWQKKRLKIFERDKFCCRLCESKEKTLHVHHIFYLKGYEPWDYADSILVTLCYECHEKTKGTDVVKFIMRMMFEERNIEAINDIMKHYAMDGGEFYMHVWNIKQEPKHYIEEMKYLNSLK